MSAARVMSTFPLCHEDRHGAVIRDLLDGCVDFVRRRLSPQRLVGIVLTGSFAQGEGSVISVAGRLKVLGDIEFFVVLADGADYRRLRAEMATWGPTAAATLGGDRVHADIEFGPVHVGYLRRCADPSIFLYDLRHHGKVLWGPPDLLEAMPAFGTEAIPREDALRLLFNRTIEQLDAYDRIATLEGEAFLDVGYQRLKLVLDLAGSALAFSGAHCASYGQRPAALARLIKETPSLARQLPASFERDLADASRVKLAPDNHDDFAGTSRRTAAAQREVLRAQIIAAVPAMTGLLRWELEQILGASGDLDHLLTRYLRAQSFARRAWDWTKLFLNPLPAPQPISVTASARLFGRSTPRALIYAAGALAYRDLRLANMGGLATGPPSPPTLGAPRQSRGAPRPLGRLLPLAGAAWPQDPEARRRAIVALWRWCVRNS